MRITVDTAKDSPEDIRKVIRFLRILVSDKGTESGIPEKDASGFFDRMESGEEPAEEKPVEEEEQEDTGIEVY